MIKTGIEPARLGVGAVDPDAAGRSKSRLAMRLWTLLHAQALLRGWATPGILEALIPGRMQGHGGTEEVPG